MPCREIRRSPASKVGAVAANFAHQRLPIAIAAGGVRFGVDECPGVEEDFAAQAGEAIELAPAAGEVTFPEVP